MDRNKSISNIERLVKRYFRETLKEKRVYYNYRPDWLKNPKTGYNLELDIYYPDLKFAVEVNGFTHRISLYQQEKDKIKKDICEKRDIYLLSIYHPRVLIRKKFLKKICPKLKKRGIIIQNNNLSYYFKKKLRLYKPQKSRKGWIIKRVIASQNYGIIQAKETESNRIREEARKRLSTLHK